MTEFRALAAAILTLAVSAPLQGEETSATPWVEVHAAHVRLIAGGTREAHYLAGVEIKMQEGWKTYWRMPGDSGVPPSFDWSGSANLGSVSVLYPAPTRMPEGGGESIGYKGAVVLPITVTPEDPAAPVSLKLAFEFGLCREICIPATAKFSVDLAPDRTGATLPAILAALDRVPRPQQSRRANDPELKRAGVAGSGSATLEIDAVFKGSADKADVFVEAPAGLYVPMPQKRVPASGGNVIRFESPLSPTLVEDLKGKTLTLTLVDEAGASEARWTFP
jgi:DsbC/DsbD-like thiol-disulfide interchange protein